jgi:hypothetical protein
LIAAMRGAAGVNEVQPRLAAVGRRRPAHHRLARDHRQVVQAVEEQIIHRSGAAQRVLFVRTRHRGIPAR